LNYPRANSPKAAQLGHGNTADIVNTLEQTLSKGYLAGGRFSAADLFMSASIDWWMFTKFLEPRAAFKEYVALCQNRPGFKSHMEKLGAIK
jgi:glutathione S-transferase